MWKIDFISLRENFNKMKVFAKDENGLSVLELLVGVVIFLGVSVGVTAAIINTTNSVSTSTESTFINNKLSIASQIIAKEISQSTSIASVDANSVTVLNDSGNLTTIATDPTTCKVTITKYAKDGVTILESSEAIDYLSDCNVFSENKGTVNITLTVTSGGKTYTVNNTAASGVYAQTSDVGAFKPAAIVAAPTGLKVSDSGASRNSIPLEWNTVADATSYIIQKSTNNVSWSIADAFILSNNLTVDYLNPATTYYFRVAAATSEGMGEFSPSIQAMTAQGQVPTAPMSVQIDNITSQGMKISWDKPGDDGGYSIYGYTVRYSLDQENWVSVPSEQTDLTLTGLNKNTLYYVQVSAVNEKGNGAWANAATYPVKTLPTGPAVPSAFALVPQAVGSTVQASWGLPADNGGDTDITYHLEKSVNNGIDWSPIGTTKELNYSITGLIKNAQYVIRIWASTGGGDSDKVSEYVSTLPTAPGLPLDFSATDITSDSITANWNKPTDEGGLQVTGYKVVYDTHTNFTNPIETTLGLTNTLRVTGLTRGTTYYFRVYGINSQGIGGNPLEGSADTTKTVPNTPELNGATNTNDSITINWKNPTDDGGDTILGYNIYMDGNKVADLAQGNSFTMTGLTELTQYGFKVTAVNTMGESAKQNDALMATTYPNPPTQPLNLAITDITSSTLSVSWEGSTATQFDGYKIYLNGVYLTSTQSTSYSINGLQGGTEYTVEVLAYNAGGASAKSAVTGTTYYSAPANFKVTSNSNTYKTATSITLNWGSVAGATNYKVYQDDNLVATNNTLTTSYTASSLNPETTYAYKVIATKDAGDITVLDTALTTLSASATEQMKVYGWGDNSNGQTTIPASLSGVSNVSTSISHSLALKSDGTVVAWGNNINGQTTIPAGLTDVTAVSAGNGFSLALKSDGTVVAWGKNTSGQATVPAGLTGVTSISAGDSFALALKSDGTVVSWGKKE